MLYCTDDRRLSYVAAFSWQGAERSKNHLLINLTVTNPLPVKANVTSPSFAAGDPIFAAFDGITTDDCINIDTHVTETYLVMSTITLVVKRQKQIEVVGGSKEGLKKALEGQSSEVEKCSIC